MRRFVSTSTPVDVVIDEAPVYFIGPATRDNPMWHVRTRVMGKVLFHDRKIKWNRITLQLVGRAGLTIQAPASSLPREAVGVMDANGRTTLQTTIRVCDIEKELIFGGQDEIEFGLHLPTHLPPTIKTQHAFVEYTLVANFSAGTFFKKYRIQRTVILKRHYLPGPSALIPSTEHHGVREFFAWIAEMPKAVALETGEVVIALRWSVEKERVEVDRVDIGLLEIETYRFTTKQGLHNLPPVTTAFPVTTYHPPTFTTTSETHFVRTLIPTTVRTHHFDPFLEIAHKTRVTIHFSQGHSPLQLEFPIIITDYPANFNHNHANTTAYNSDPIPSQPSAGNATVIPGDDAVAVDLDLPEYTPRYEHVSAES